MTDQTVTGIAARHPVNEPTGEARCTAAVDGERVAVNAWIRGAGVFDGVLDFDGVMRDPDRPARMLPAYDSGDHLHPGDTGLAALAGSVDLGLLR